MDTYLGLPVKEFDSEDALRTWLAANYQSSAGIWVRLYKKHSGIRSVTFEGVLDQGLCFGWSESLRHSGDDRSYLQKFTPRKTRGTASERNRARAQKLIAQDQVTPAGLAALGLS